jgi:hypothetical protein
MSALGFRDFADEVSMMLLKDVKQSIIQEYQTHGSDTDLPKFRSPC